MESKKKLQGLTPLDQERLIACKINLENSLTTVRELKRLGVKIAAGDDAGWSSLISPFTPFDSFFEELEALTAGGMTPLEAITSATKISAEAVGLADRLGTIEVGKVADMLVVKGEPFRNIEDLRNVQLVVKEGIVEQRSVD